VRLAGYVRVSRVGGREGDSFISPDVQRSQIESWASLRGATIDGWHVDLDESGGTVKRPGLREAIERCERGEVDGMAVAKIDRFARSLSGALDVIARLDACGAQFVSVAEGIDPTTPAGKMMQRLMLILAEFELDRIRESWRTAQDRAVTRGVHISSAVPTGYVRGDDGVLVPHEVFGPAVADAFRLRASGGGWGEVCRLLEERGVVGPYGNTRWQRRVVKRLLQNRVYLGEARSGEFVNAHAHQPLIDRMTFERVQEAPQAVTRGEGALLSGLLRCAGCRYAMKADWMKDRSGERLRLYRCRGDHGESRCEDRAAVLGSVIEPRVEQWFLRETGQIELAGSDTDARHEEAERALGEAEAELAAYRDAELISVIGREAYVDGLKQRAAAVEEARAALASVPVSALPSSAVLASMWPELTIPERRRLLTAGIGVVFIRSGRNLPLHERVAILGPDDIPDDLPRRGRRVAAAPIRWNNLPAGARNALAHDLREDAGD
jgi:site-specific DNA recombinase